jgi:hypothetical protein
MPILTAIKAISGSYPDIALNPYKYFFEKKVFSLSAFFTLWASRSCRIYFVTAHSQWMTTAGVRLCHNDEKRTAF